MQYHSLNLYESNVYIERKTRLREDVDIYIYDCYNRLCREYGLKPDEPRETYPYDHYASLYLSSNTFDAWFSLLDGEVPVQDLEEMFQESGIYAQRYQKDSRNGFLQGVSFRKMQNRCRTNSSTDPLHQIRFFRSLPALNAA